MATEADSSTKKDQDVSQLYTRREKAETQTQSVKYTLFASGLRNGGRDVELKNKNTSNDIAILFDVVENHSYTRGVSKTQYATENKVNFSDHAVIEDGKFSFSARVNSSPMYLIQNNYIDKDTDPDNPLQSKRPQKALDILDKMIEDRELVTLVAEDMILENYICTNMTAERSNDSGDALVFNLEFTEFRTFILGKTVLATVYTNPKKSGKTKQKGAVQSSATDDGIEVTARRTKFAGPNKDGWQKVADGMDSGNFTKQDQVIGTLTPDGKIRGADGTIMDYNKAVGN